MELSNGFILQIELIHGTWSPGVEISKYKGMKSYVMSYYDVVYEFIFDAKKSEITGIDANRLSKTFWY